MLKFATCWSSVIIAIAMDTAVNSSLVKFSQVLHFLSLNSDTVITSLQAHEVQPSITVHALHFHSHNLWVSVELLWSRGAACSHHIVKFYSPIVAPLLSGQLEEAEPRHGCQEEGSCRSGWTFLFLCMPDTTHWPGPAIKWNIHITINAVSQEICYEFEVHLLLGLDHTVSMYRSPNCAH